MRNSFVLAMLLAVMLTGPSAALASTKCICNNGKVMSPESDDEDACETSCDLFGGGRAWLPEDDENAEKAQDGEDVAPTRRRVNVNPPAAVTPGSGVEDPRFRP